MVMQAQLQMQAMQTAQLQQLIAAQDARAREDRMMMMQFLAAIIGRPGGAGAGGGAPAQ